MKLWKVMKLLEENPTDVYEAKMNEVWKVRMTAKEGFVGYYHFEVFNGKRVIDQSRGGGGFNDNVHFDLDWQLVKQPITWQEAIEAWVDGKTISYSYKGYDRRYGFKDSDTMLLSIEKIEDGKWYIENEREK